MTNVHQASTRGRTVSQNNSKVKDVKFARTTAQNNQSVVAGSKLSPRVRASSKTSRISK